MEKTRYEITFVLEVEGSPEEDTVKEAVESLVDKEIAAHARDKSASRESVRFHDALLIQARKGDDDV